MKKFSFLFLIPMLMMLAVPFQSVADDFVRGDCNLDGNVNISDVATLIDYLLNEHWPDEEPETVTYVLNGIEINMVRVEGGTFTMGASGNDVEASDDEYPAHIVTLSPYYICTTEVTQQLWRAVMGSNPSYFTGNLLCPVEEVSWIMCQQFITKLNEMTGQNFRLPTEAEWEFAARGGNKSKGYKYAGGNDINEVAWNSDNASSMTHPVGTKVPNELGLYDMTGNVWEWCYDWYGSYTATDGQTDPQGPSTGSNRVFRGGCWGNSSLYSRVTIRRNNTPSFSSYHLGLRLAL